MENKIEWKDVEDSLGYQVSNTGLVKRLPYERVHNINKTNFTTKERLLKPNSNNSKGYLRLLVRYKHYDLVESVHRLVAKAFISNPENKPQVNHIDGNKLNNDMLNLEWVDNFENARHAVLNLPKRKHRKGEGLHSNILTEEAVRAIPDLLRKNKSKAAVARDLGVSPTTITEITSGRSWRHLGLFTPRPRKCEKYFKEIRYVPTTTER